MNKNENIINLGLQRIKKVLNFEYQTLNVIHIAGTNGKGSVCAFLNNILISNGKKVGLYTSPHFYRANERIKINNQEISDIDLKKYIESITNENLTYFEALTAVAIKYFYDQKVDIVILETGLGGRLDATNVFDKPLATVLTSISMDHMEYLGGALEDILEEKMGILKSNVPIVSGFSHPNLIARANQLNVKSYYVSSQIPFSLKLNGKHQLLNANIAYIVAKKILNIDVDIRPSIENTTLIGRLELIDNFLFDVCHNEAGVENSIEFIKTLEGKKILVLGLLKDKNYKKIISLIIDHFEEIYLTQPNSERALNAEVLRDEIALQNPNKKVKIYKYNEIIDQLKINELNNTICCVLGSFYLVAELRRLILQTFRLL